MSVNHRCSLSGCRQRVTLAKLVTMYIREPVCPGCGCHSLKPDLSVKKRNKKLVCYCDAYPFPHSKNSVFCSQSKKIPTDEQYRNRYHA